MSKAPKPEAQEDPAAESTVVAKLRAHRDAKSGTSETILPQTDVTVTWPKFLKHGYWMRAQRLAKGDSDKATTLYLISVCKFDGDRLTLEEFEEFIPTPDALHLVGEVMGDDEDDEGGEGNALH